MTYSGSSKNKDDASKSGGFFKYSPTAWYEPENYNRATRPPSEQDAFGKAKQDARTPLDEPTYKTPLDPENAYSQALSYNNKVNDRGLIDIKDAGASAASLSKDAMKDKEFYDTRAKRLEQTIDQENALFDNNLRRNTDDARTFTIGGIVQNQNMSNTDRERVARSEYGRGLGVMREQANIDFAKNQRDALNALNLANTQAANQRQLASISAASQERIARLQAQGGVFSSLFGGLSAGSQNYRYW